MVEGDYGAGPRSGSVECPAVREADAPRHDVFTRGSLCRPLCDQAKSLRTRRRRADGAAFAGPDRGPASLGGRGCRPVVICRWCCPVAVAPGKRMEPATRVPSRLPLRAKIPSTSRRTTTAPRPARQAPLRRREGDRPGRAHLFIVALVTGRADECSCRRESVAVGRMWRTLPRTYVRGYGADVATQGRRVKIRVACGGNRG